VVEILKDEKTEFGNFKNSECGLVAVQTSVGVFPEISVDRPQGGMYLLNKTPSGNFSPSPFVQGSRAELVKTMVSVRKNFSHVPIVVAAWEKFLTEAPQDDNANAYMDTHPLDVPFQNELFSG